MTNLKTKKTTHYIHRTSYSFQEKLVGAFILIALGILLTMLLAQIKHQNIFEEHFVIYGKMSSAAGLSNETIIQVSGFEVGQVSNIEITDNNDILVSMNIIRRYHRLLRSDSRIKISSLNATIIGKSIIEITAGSPELELINEGAILEIEQSTSVDEVISNAKATIKTINKVIEGISAAVNAIEPEKINSTLDSFARLAANLEDISADIKKGQGPTGTLLYDQELTMELKQGIENLNQATLQIKEMMTNLNTDSKKVPEILENINSVVVETEETIKATQRIWPVSSAINKPKSPPLLINPANNDD